MTESAPRYTILDQGQSFQEKSALHYFFYDVLISTELAICILSLVFFILINLSIHLIVLSVLGTLFVILGWFLSYLAKSSLDEKKQFFAMIIFCIAGALCLSTSIISLDLVVISPGKHQPSNFLHFLGVPAPYDSNIYDSAAQETNAESLNYYYGYNIHSKPGDSDNSYAYRYGQSYQSPYQSGYTTYSSPVSNNHDSINSGSVYGSESVYSWSETHNNPLFYDLYSNNAHQTYATYQLSKTKSIPVSSLDTVLTLTLFPLQIIILIGLIYQSYALRFTIREKKRLAEEGNSSVIAI